MDYVNNKLDLRQCVEESETQNLGNCKMRNKKPVQCQQKNWKNENKIKTQFPRKQDDFKKQKNSTVKFKGNYTERRKMF